MKHVTQEKLVEVLGKERLKKNIDLFPYLTLRTHTTAQYFFEAKTKEDLQKAKKAAIKLNLPILFIGGGSNIALLNNTYHGLIVKNSYIKKEIIKEDDNSVTLLFSSGYPVSMIVNYTIENGYQGFEYQKGLPGTLGGAIAMNSKWMRPISYISDSLQSAILLDNKGEFKHVDRSYFEFSYDYSTLKKTGEIFVEGVFCCKKQDPKILTEKSQEALGYRMKSQPIGVATCGCFFKNISLQTQKEKKLPSTSVGYLLDSLGLKNLTVGDYAVSDKHANFIINRGNGNPQDLVKLLGIIKEKVRNKYGIELEEEVIII